MARVRLRSLSKIPLQRAPTPLDDEKRDARRIYRRADADLGFTVLQLSGAKYGDGYWEVGSGLKTGFVMFLCLHERNTYFPNPENGRAIKRAPANLRSTFSNKIFPAFQLGIWTSFFFKKLETNVAISQTQRNIPSQRGILVPRLLLPPQKFVLLGTETNLCQCGSHS